jgi:hypothetical protein
VPFLITRGVARFFQTPGRSSIALARLLVGLPVYLAWYALVGWWLAGRFAPWTAGLWLGAMPFCGVLALHYWRRARESVRHGLQQANMCFRREQLRKLREEQLAIQHELRAPSERFAEIQPRGSL